MGGGGPSTITQQTKSDLPAQVQPYAGSLLQGGYNLATQANPYPSQPIAPMNPLQQLGLGLTAQRALAGSPVQAAQDQNLTKTLNGDYLNPATNPAWGPMSSAITDAYQRGTAAQTDAAAARANALDSTGYREQVGVNQRSLADSLSGLAGDLYNTGRQQQLQAGLMVPGSNAATYSDLQNLIGTGDVARQYNQDVLNAAYTNTYNQAQYPYTSLDVLSNALRAATGSSGQATSTGPNPYQANPAAQAIGLGSLGLGTYGMLSSLGLFGGGAGVLGGAGMAGAGAGIGEVAPLAMGFSDRRLKKDIKRIGEKDGYGIYSFKYKWDDTEYVGVMADEVEHIPGAVTRFGGVAVVNYGAL